MHGTVVDLSLNAAASRRKLKRTRSEERAAAALLRQPELVRDRLAPMRATLRWYLDPPDRPGPLGGPLASRLSEVRAEVESLEASVALLPRSVHASGDAIRRALNFLRGFGRLSALDFDAVPPEDRPHLVALLALEYRWCFAAAQTTPRVFKIAIGRTGAR
jgi:hypothetical protein